MKQRDNLRSRSAPNYLYFKLRRPPHSVWELRVSPVQLLTQNNSHINGEKADGVFKVWNKFEPTRKCNLLTEGCQYMWCGRLRWLAVHVRKQRQTWGVHIHTHNVRRIWVSTTRYITNILVVFNSSYKFSLVSHRCNTHRCLLSYYSPLRVLDTAKCY